MMQLILLGRRSEMEQQTENKDAFLQALNAKLYIDFFSGCGGLSLGLGFDKWNGLFAI